MKRRVLNLVTALSLLLCVAAAVLWVRGHWVRDVLGRFDQQGDGWVLATPGKAGGLEWSLRRVTPAAGSRRRLALHSAARDPNAIVAGVRANWVGFGAEGFTMYVSTSRGTERNDWSGVVVPHWVLVVALGALPAGRSVAWSVRRRRARRLAPESRCPGCGYDLTGNVSGVCPECGAPAPRRSNGGTGRTITGEGVSGSL